jgi:hypothetical protein
MSISHSWKPDDCLFGFISNAEQAASGLSVKRAADCCDSKDHVGNGLVQACFDLGIEMNIEARSGALSTSPNFWVIHIADRLIS